MSSFPSACKTIYVSPSPSSRGDPCDSVGVSLSQGGCLTYDQGQMMGTEHSLMEMTDYEYTHLQHLIQTHMEAQAAPPDGPDVRSHCAAVMVKDATVISPLPTTQAIDLSTSTEEHCVVMPGENTPESYGEVPGFVLARIRGANTQTESPATSTTSLQKRSSSAARVCLEKRFNSMSTDAPRQQDIHFLTMLQQSAEAQEAVIHLQMQKWIKTDRANPFEVTSPYVGGVYNPVTNMCGQVIGHIPHMVDPNKHQSLIIPKSFSFNFCPERVVTKTHFTSSSNAAGKVAGEQQLVNIENDLATPSVSSKHGSTHSSHPVKANAAPDSAAASGSSTRKTARSGTSFNQRRERHNSRERERRKRIRLCCDELNMLVPFCDSDTDKVTTLQWTTTFLRYINKTYGDTFKKEFQSAFTDKKELFLKSCPSSGQDPFQQEMHESLNVPLAVEQ